MVHSKLVAVLKEYRLVNSSSLRQPGNRLVFPHNLRLLPLLIHGLIRSSGLRGGFKDTLIDDRMVALYSLMEAPIDTFVRIVYPTVYVVHDPSGPWGQEVEGRVPLPSVAPASALFMAETGAYLIDNGVQLLLWLGRGIAREWCVDVSDLAQILSMRERTD
jgi:protein transport protein SEC24